MTPTTRPLLCALVLLAACGGGSGTTTSPATSTATDPAGDCRTVTARVDTVCRTGTDIVSAELDTDPMVVVVELDSDPEPSDEVQWVFEVRIDQLACVIDNLVEGDDGFVGSTGYTSYGYNLTTQQLARDGTCVGVVTGSTVTMNIAIQAPERPYVVNATVELISLIDESDPGAADDVRLTVEATP